MAALLVTGCSGAPAPEPVPPPTVGTGPPTTITTSTAEVPTTVAPSTTSTSAAPRQVVLGPDGLGVVAFGDPATTVLARLTQALGPPVDDRPLASCPTGEADRLVQFAELAVVLAGTGSVERFVAWDVGLASGAIPALRTAAGVGVGSSVAELRATYGVELALDAGDPFGPRFEVRLASGVISGTLTGTRRGDTVASLGAGDASCGI